MERTQHIKSNRSRRNLYERDANFIRILVIFHLVGLIGLYLPPTKPYFLHLVPFHLWLMALIVLLSHDGIKSKFFLFAGLAALTGWLVEFAGVRTGALFGDYSYGHTLGLKIAGIPILMGVNWFVLIYAAGVAMCKLKIRSMFLRILGGATLLIILDFLIEPVAMRMDYWHWNGNEVPLQNYACWFVVSALLLFVFERFKFGRQSMVAPTMLICQFIFFAALQ